MKKVLLFITAILFGLGAFAQTVSMPWNQYAGAPKIAYQGKDASKVATYTPVAGDVVTVTIAGTADQDISAFQVALVDDAPPSYWTELAGFKALGPVTAGVPFSFTVDLAVTATGSPKLVFDGTNATLAGADGTGTAINLDLTTFTVSIFSPIPGATVLTDNGQGAKQGTFTKLGTTPVAIGDVVRVNLQGVSDVVATEFQVIIVDESADATSPYWTELSAYTDFTPAEVADGPLFNITADVTITAAPIGTGVKFQNIVLMAKSAAGLIQLSLTDFTATIIGQAPTLDKTAIAAAISAATTKVGAAVEGTAVGNYAVGSKAILTSAIAAAQSASDAATIQSDITTALSTLNAAVASFDAGIVTSGGTVVATVTMPWNQYAAAPKTAYQGKDASKVATYTPVAGDVVTVTIEGTADQNIAAFQVALVDDAPPSYWTELAGFKALGPVTAGVPFSFTVDLAVTATGSPKLVFDGVNATLAGADGTGTAINLDLTAYTVSIFSPIPGATVLTDNGQGAKQGTFTKLPAGTPVAIGDVVTVNLKGVSDVDVTEFQVIVVDESSDAASPYWTELSAYTDFTPAAFTAGQTFDITADITITAAPIGTEVKYQNIVLMAKTTAGLIQLSLTDFTATIGGQTPTLDKTAIAAAISAATTKVGAAVEGTAVGNYAVGSKAILTTAIAAAQSASDAATIQSDITTALATLNAAVSTFDGGLVTVGPVDKSALTTAIAAATTKVGAAIEGTATGNYAVGSKAILTTAIAAAQSASDAATTAGQVTTALNNLNTAVATFEAGKVAAFTANFTMPWNQYAAAPKTAYQGKDASKVSTYTPAIGDVVTVTIEGTSNQNITGFQVALVDDAPPAYWKELAAFGTLGDVTAGVPFSFTVDLPVIATGSPKLVFDGVNATLAGADGTGTTIGLNFTTYTATFALAPVDKTELTTAISDAQTLVSGASEGTAIGDYIVGSKAILITAILTAQGVIDNTNSTAGQVASAITALETAVATFEASVVTAIDSIGNSIAISIIDGIVTVNAPVSSISIATIAGSIVSNSSNISGLANGSYVAIVTLTNGSVISQIIVK